MSLEQPAKPGSQDGSTDTVRLWKLLPDNNPLVKLSILILSFILNSASVEQLFSNLGDIKTKKCNQLGTKKLQDTVSGLHG